MPDLSRSRRQPRSRGHTLIARAAALVAGLLLSQLAGALPDDRDQPIHITADTAVRDEKQGVTVYSGNVHMIQGSLDIVADTITIYHETAEADKIVAEGKPATMKQRPAVDEPMVHARAEIIEYYKIEDRVHLQRNAHITRDDGSSVTGDSIDYYIADELVKADSERSPDSKRVQVVIPSKLVREEDDKGADGPAQSN
jgi:lipopolysaccharide export system protein LptA